MAAAAAAATAGRRHVYHYRSVHVLMCVYVIVVVATVTTLSPIAADGDQVVVAAVAQEVKTVACQRSKIFPSGQRHTLTVGSTALNYDHHHHGVRQCPRMGRGSGQELLV